MYGISPEITEFFFYHFIYPSIFSTSVVNRAAPATKTPKKNGLRKFFHRPFFEQNITLLILPHYLPNQHLGQVHVWQARQ